MAKGFVRNICAVLQSITVAAILYGLLYMGFLAFHRGSFPKTPTDLYSAPKAASSPHSEGVPKVVSLPSPKLHVNKISPHANWFNRPESLVVPKDDYLGERPHVDTVANLTRLVEQCRGTYENIEKMPYVYDCLKYLETGEDDYYYIPPNGERESEQAPKSSEYLNSDGHNNTLSVYPIHKLPSEESIGQCNGPIVPYHVYWAGPATWRVELFIKSHLYTQNLPCVRLWLWLDADRNPNAVEQMLNHDPLFKKFLPFLKRGDIALKAWRFPSRIPLPAGDNTDGAGYYKTPGKPNADNEVLVADGLIRDADDQEWLVLTERQKTFLPVAVSDAVRFVVLHIHGGAYFDMDVIMLRDLRPLLIGDTHSFAERWGGHPSPGDYNTAIMSLTANSSLSSYLVRGGVRMGLNFHPRIIGVMAVKDHRNQEFHMLETAAFDPIWGEFNGDRMGRCTVPCIHDYGQVFKSKNAFPLHDEWESYDGEPLELKPTERAPKDLWDLSLRSIEEQKPKMVKKAGVEAFNEDLLRDTEYKIEEDLYPPTNRTLENFFRGAWTYHVHNQWVKNPEPSSWLNVVQRAHDGFFSQGRLNPYGEKWDSPSLPPYEHSWEYP